MFRERVSLKSHTSYRIGGAAKFFYEAKDERDLRDSLQEAKRLRARVFILGGATNLLFDENGFDGAVIKASISSVAREKYSVRVGAGLSVSSLLDFCAREELSGFEWAGGLPGTVGGAIRGNAGAFGGEIKDSIERVRSIDIHTLEERERTAEQCEFDYRTSIYKTMGGREVITGATFLLAPGSGNNIRNSINEKISYREMRHPMEYPNAGSVFKNVPLARMDARSCYDKQGNIIVPVKQDPFPVVPVAYLISESGLGGVSCGGAMISPKHSNFIVNICDATAKDVTALIALVKQEVKKKFFVDLEEEIQIV